MTVTVTVTGHLWPDFVPACLVALIPGEKGATAWNVTALLVELAKIASPLYCAVIFATPGCRYTDAVATPLPLTEPSPAKLPLTRNSMSPVGTPCVDVTVAETLSG